MKKTVENPTVEISSIISINLLNQTYCRGTWLGSQTEDDNVYAVEYHPNLIWTETRHYGDNNTIEISEAYSLWKEAAQNAFEEYNS